MLDSDPDVNKKNSCLQFLYVTKTRSTFNTSKNDLLMSICNGLNPQHNANELFLAHVDRQNVSIHASLK